MILPTTPLLCALTTGEGLHPGLPTEEETKEMIQETGTGNTLAEGHQRIADQRGDGLALGAGQGQDAPEAPLRNTSQGLG